MREAEAGHWRVEPDNKFTLRANELRWATQVGTLTTERVRPFSRFSRRGYHDRKRRRTWFAELGKQQVLHLTNKFERLTTLAGV
jgi:hypothetical protein